MLMRGVMATIGGVLIVIGVPLALVTPFPFIPIGVPVVVLGVVLLARNSILGKRWIGSVLKKHPRLERFAPDWLLKLIFGK